MQPLKNISRYQYISQSNSIDKDFYVKHMSVCVCVRVRVRVCVGDEDFCVCVNAMRKC